MPSSVFLLFTGSGNGVSVEAGSCDAISLANNCVNGVSDVSAALAAEAVEGADVALVALLEAAAVADKIEVVIVTFGYCR